MQIRVVKWGFVSQLAFRGGPVLTLDGKGRLTVPARWRDQLMASDNGQLIAAKNVDGCLSLYPLSVWNPFEALLLALPSENDAWRRFFIGSATEAEIDSGSRVLLAPELRAWAGPGPGSAPHAPRSGRCPTIRSTDPRP